MNGAISKYVDKLLVQAKRKSPLARIASRTPNLRGKTRDVAQFLVQNVEALEHMTIEEIAAACDTSRATIVRASNELGYQNFTQLRDDVMGTSGQNVADEHTGVPGDLDISMKRCLTMLLDTYATFEPSRIEKATELLLTHSPIVVYGGAVSGGIARVVHNCFRRLGLSVYASSDLDQVVDDIVQKRTGVLLCVSHLAGSPNVLRVITQARQRGIPSILLTNLDAAPACKEAELVLTTNVTSVQADGYDVLARTAQLFVIEMLCNEIVRQREKRVSNEE